MSTTDPTVGQIEAANVDAATGIRIPVESAERDPMQFALGKAWGAGGKVWAHGLCKICGATIAQEVHALDVGFDRLNVPVSLCEQCAPLVRDHYSSYRRAETSNVALTPLWDDCCPERFRELITTDAYPAHFDQGAQSRVLAWDTSSARGVALVGDSGAGKTTSLWALFRKIERAGGNPKFVTGIELARILARSARDLDRLDWLWQTRALIIDDFGKEKVTPAATSLLWEMLDRRYQNKMPLLLSCRYTGSELTARLGEPQLGGDIIRRMNDSCGKIEFRRQCNI